MPASFLIANLNTKLPVASTESDKLQSLALTVCMDTLFRDWTAKVLVKFELEVSVVPFCHNNR